jgi:hypothetical protein
MGDKSPKSIGKNKKQKTDEKDKANKKAQMQADSKKVNVFSSKKK